MAQQRMLRRGGQSSSTEALIIVQQQIQGVVTMLNNNQNGNCSVERLDIPLQSARGLASKENGGRVDSELITKQQS